MTLPTLTSIWRGLSTDERLNIVMEQLSTGCAERAKEPPPNNYAAARLAGYSHCLADIMYYVVEGHPLPEVGDL